MALLSNLVYWTYISTFMSMSLGLSFRNQPDTVNAYAGETIFLRCSVNLDPNVPGSSVSVTWIKSDNRKALKYISVRDTIVQAYADPARYSIAGDPNLGEHDLRIENVQYEDAGMYWCQATGSGQFMESITGRLTVQVPIPTPQCSMNPPTPRVGQQVTLNCDQQMHPSVNYEALNWWNETSRSKILTQRRYSDGSIYFTRLLTENDRNQRFICSQGSALVDGEKNCTITPLPAIEVSTITNPTVVINPEVKYVTEGSSATFGCRSGVGPVTRWVYGYGSRASKIRDTKGRFLVSADRSELTVIRTTLNDNGTAVRCIVMAPSGEKLIGRSTLNVLPSSTQPAATNPRIQPPPPPPASTPRYRDNEQATSTPTEKESTQRKDTSTANNPSTTLTENGETLTSLHTTVVTVTTKITADVDPTTRRDVVQIGANTETDIGLDGTEANTDQNHAEAPKTGGGYKANIVKTHQVSNQGTPGQSNNGAGVAGAVIGTLLIIALIVLIIFLIKTKRYPKKVPTWVPPQVVAALKRPIDLVKKSGADGSQAGKSGKSSKDSASMRMRQIEVVVNPPPPEWQFRLKDVESNNAHVTNVSNSPRKSHIQDGPVYANLSPNLSKSNIEDAQIDDDDDDNDSLFSSDFDDDLDLEGEIAAEIAARSNDLGPRDEGEGNAMDSIEERKSRNVEGLVYAQLDMGPDAVKRSTVFIEGEKTQYAHIQVGNTANVK